MGDMNDWRVERHDEEIERLKERLYEAEDKLRYLERRPLDWVLKVEIALFWIAIAAFWVFTIVEIASKNN